MEKKTEECRPGCLYGITAFILLQCLTFVFVNVWQEWRLDSFRSRIAEKDELLALLENDCDYSLGFLPKDHGQTRIRRQGPTMTDFMREFLSVQEKALETVCSRRQDLCIPGPKGEEGARGPIGPRGDSGLTGSAGQKGDQGSVGLKGDGGGPGPKGLMGAVGSTGTVGAKGVKGTKGDIGAMGSRGVNGQRGNGGTTGPTGDWGEAGLKGGAGTKGGRGVPGVKGEVGPAGMSGQKGVAGIRGVNGRLLHSECLCLNAFKMIGNFSDIVNVPYGAPLTLHCEFNMMSIPVTWSKDGGPISQKANVTGNDLDFLQVLKNDGGTYKCSGPVGILGYVSKSVTVVVGPTSMYDCDFESPCSWTDSTDDKMDWTRHAGRTPTANTGPTHDHTFDNAPGNYIYLETSSGFRGANAALQSKPLSAHHTFCLTFWYHMYGSSIGSLEVRLKQPGKLGAPLWTKTGNQGDQWSMAKIELPPQTTSYYVIINAIRGSFYTGDIAIDDIIFLDGRKGTTGDQGPTGPRGDPGLFGPAGQKGHRGSVGLTGDKGGLGHKGLMGVKGRAGSLGTKGMKGAKGTSGDMGLRGEAGPRGKDGATGLHGNKGAPGLKGGLGPKGLQGMSGTKGEAGQSGLPGEAGLMGVRGLDGRLLHSECLCLNTFKIMSNFSHTVNVPYGSPLSLHCEFNTGNIPVTWSKDGGQISTRASVTGSYLDFVQVLKNDGGTYMCSGPVGILGYVIKSVNVVVGPISMYDCDFESPCSWTDVNDDKLDWIRHTGRTPTFNTGPTHDHTFDSVPGNYIYLETSSGYTGYNAALQSKPLSAHHRFCLTFWYHMYGSSMGTLQVELKEPGTFGVPLWSKSGDQGNQWAMAKVNLPPQQTSFYVVLNAIRGSGYQGDIAIDDIIFLDGLCP